MGKVRVSSFGISIDGFGAGHDQDLKHPLGHGGEELMQWFFATRTWKAQHALDQGTDSGETGIDDRFAREAMSGIGAWILGRNMFGPIRGPWPDMEWRGWWGEEPPYHVPVFVLTHYPRPSLEMQGGTVFHFVTDGIEAALARARDAAGALDVRIGGGASTIRQYIAIGAIDELRLAASPVLLGRGERLFAGIDWRALGYRCVERVAGERTTHLVIAKQADSAPPRGESA